MDRPKLRSKIEHSKNGGTEVLLAGSGHVAVGGRGGNIGGHPVVALTFERLPPNRLRAGQPVPEDMKGIGPPLMIIFADRASLEGTIKTLVNLKLKLIKAMESKQG